MPYFWSFWMHLFLQGLLCLCVRVSCSCSGAHWRLFGSSCSFHVLLSSPSHQCCSCSPASGSAWGDCVFWRFPVFECFRSAFPATDLYFLSFKYQKDTRLQRLDILNKIEKVPDYDLIWHSSEFFFFLFFFWPPCKMASVLQLFMVLLEVEETERMKTPLLSEAEERRLVEKIQRKVEHIYSQLQHHNPLWVMQFVI